MTTRTYSNNFETYTIYKFTEGNRTYYRVGQDGIFAEGIYPRLKDAKKAIDNQEIYF